MKVTRFEYGGKEGVAQWYDVGKAFVIWEGVAAHLVTFDLDFQLVVLESLKK